MPLIPRWLDCHSASRLWKYSTTLSPLVPPLNAQPFLKTRDVHCSRLSFFNASESMGPNLSSSSCINGQPCRRPSRSPYPHRWSGWTPSLFHYSAHSFNYWGHSDSRPCRRRSRSPHPHWWTSLLFKTPARLFSPHKLSRPKPLRSYPGHSDPCSCCRYSCFPIVTGGPANHCTSKNFHPPVPLSMYIQWPNALGDGYFGHSDLWPRCC
ncbi:hypothetical protein BDP27DRAFT_216843 [Rhodocollybia butyracea]|uniref:Uncharacterized protein n=1 Tax=Rhodocollybia butyracea TaxID=206335 RepID=A0A9P5PKP7_9AGAR|nr:hypothetical protein BDP27DRAFT_216843 [Rhodocollybia butyracea]